MEPLPKSPKVFGILSIIAGGLFVLSSLNRLEGPIQVSSTGFDSTMNRDLDNLTHATMYLNLLLGVMAAWLVVIGIGQIRYRRWARRQAIVWSVASCLTVITIDVVLLAIVAPAMWDDWLATALAIITPITLVPYPIILLAHSCGSKARSSMLR